MKMTDKTKVRLVVKTFLLANKGKWYTSRQLCDFMNNNNLSVKWGITPTALSHFLDAGYLRREGITRERKTGKSVWSYGVEA